MYTTDNKGHKGKGNTQAQRERRKDRQVQEGRYICTICNISLKTKDSKYKHQKTKTHQRNEI